MNIGVEIEEVLPERKLNRGRDAYNHRIVEARNRFEVARAEQRTTRAEQRQREQGERWLAAVRAYQRQAAQRRGQEFRRQKIAYETPYAERIQRWARKIAWREDWKKKLLGQGNMPIGVDQKTINYIRNIIMTHDDRSLKEWIQKLADGQERIQEQNNQFFEWARANKGYDKGEDYEPSQPWEFLGLGNSPAETKKAEAPYQTPKKASQRVQLQSYRKI